MFFLCPIPAEDPLKYHPPADAMGSLVYNLFSMGGLRMVLRSNDHGLVRRDKKNVHLYLTSKMEFQPGTGFEQVIGCYYYLLNDC